MSWMQAAQGAMKMAGSMGGGGGKESGPMDIAGKVQTKQERNKTIAEVEPKDAKKTKLGGVF